MPRWRMRKPMARKVAPLLPNKRTHPPGRRSSPHAGGRVIRRSENTKPSIPLAINTRVRPSLLSETLTGKLKYNRSWKRPPLRRRPTLPCEMSQYNNGRRRCHPRKRVVEYAIWHRRTLMGCKSVILGGEYSYPLRLLVVGPLTRVKSIVFD